jgi:hypothetical protein
MIKIQYRSGIFKYIQVQQSFNFSYPTAIRLNVGALKPISRHRKLTQVPTATTPGTESPASPASPSLLTASNIYDVDVETLCL